MKDFVEITLIWITYIFWMIILFGITCIGLGALKGIGLSYENSICTIYGYILGMVCFHIVNRLAK